MHGKGKRNSGKLDSSIDSVSGGSNRFDCSRDFSSFWAYIACYSALIIGIMLLVVNYFIDQILEG
jgi:hypothetical protein